jgi:hypothetical protein
MAEPVTPEHQYGLDIARRLIKAGVPVFAAPPCPGQECGRAGHGDGRHEYDLPVGWQKTVASEVWLERWQPGWALAAVGGVRADFIDEDPRHGGDGSRAELISLGQWPRVFGVQKTPSGGAHYLISPLGEREANGFMPGLDYQGGMPDGTSRAFVWIAPTVRRSKAEETLGQLRGYEWVVEPDLVMLEEFAGSDDSGEGLVARLHAHRAPRTRESALSSASGVTQLFGPAPFGLREYTLAEAFAFCAPAVDALRQAPRGTIEETANATAAALSHFVPAFWSVDEAYGFLLSSLAETDYDPSHPASGWTADKFRAVLDGSRPVADPWVAARRVSPAEAAAAFGQAEQVTAVPGSPEEAEAMVDALLAEMLTPDELSERPAPKALVKGLLTLDSIAWVIGAPGSKKSFVVLDMAAHVVRGELWQGLKVHRGPVVMIVAEGAGGMSTRVRAYQQKHGPIGAGMRVLPRPVQVSDVTGWQVLVEACRRLEPVLVVVDTQARVTVGLEENSARDMGVFIAAAERIRQATGACVMVVHHTGRAGGDARGSSAIDGAQGTELKVVRQDAMTGVLRVEKQKDLQERPEMPLYFERVVVGVDEDGDEVSSLVLLEANAFQDAQRAVPVQEEYERESLSVKEMIVRVLTENGEDLGITSAVTRRIVVERFFGQDPKRVRDSTWTTSWGRAAKDPRVIQVQQRLVRDPLAGGESS